MPRFFIRKDQIIDTDGTKTVHITGDDAHHISRSLRMAAGEKIEVSDMQRMLYECELVEFLEKEVVARVLSERCSDVEPVCEITLYQALPKGDKMETVIQKSIECGAFKIIPFKSERSIVKIDKKDEEKKRARWQKIAEGAAKQSGRAIIPEIGPIMSFEEAIESACKSSLVLLCYEAEDKVSIKDALRNVKIEKTISVIIGSEGGFSEKEAQLAISKGAKSVTLGKRILRTETASSFVLACIAYETEL